MEKKDNSFATVITCIDGRIQESAAKWAKKEFEVEFVDMITWPGAECVLAGTGDEIIALRKNINKRLTNHASPFIIIAGHDHCTYNNVLKDEKVKQLQTAIKVVQSWKLEGVKSVRGIYIEERWIPEEIELPADERQNEGEEKKKSKGSLLRKLASKNAKSTRIEESRGLPQGSSIQP